MATNLQNCKKKRKPTLRQRKAAENLVKLGTKADALRAAGYAENVAKNPQMVTETPSFKAMLEEFMPDHLLLKTHLELLDAVKPHGTDSDFIMVADNTVRLNAAKLGYQVKGKLDTQSSVDVESNGTKFTINIGARQE